MKSFKNQVLEEVKWVRDKFFKEWNLPLPEIIIRPHINYAMASMYVRFDKCLSTQERYVTYCFEIRKSVLQDKKLLRKTVTHEMIHLWQYYIMSDHDLVQLVRYGIGDSDGHGFDFMNYAVMINSIMGERFVTLTWEKKN